MKRAAALDALAGEEVIALHAFFVAWFRDESGSVPDFSACEDAFAPDFRMIAPDGQVYHRKETLERLRAARGALDSSFRIEVFDIRPVWASDEAVLLEYIEQQYRDGRSTRRRSTGLFVRGPTAPRGVLWRHLQETWLEPAQVEEAQGQSNRGRKTR